MRVDARCFDGSVFSDGVMFGAVSMRRFDSRLRASRVFCTGSGGFVRYVMHWRGEAASRKKRQCCKRQKGRYGGVQTHHDVGGAERQSNFYIKD